MTATPLSETRIPDPPAPRYELEGWRRDFGVVAGVTGRERSFALRQRDGGEPGPVDPAAWDDLLEVLGPGFAAAAAGQQVHGAALATHREPTGRLAILPGVDGHVTNRPGLLLGVTLADCVPVYVVHPVSGTMALLHAGWRGTAAGILEGGIEAVCKVAAAPPQELIMHCGVGICGVCYQVGSEVLRAITGRGDRPGRLDLRRELAGRAGALGVARITTSLWCTAHDRDRFCSHRASGGADGRMVAYLGRPKA
jgi:hypothetical protein